MPWKAQEIDGKWCSVNTKTNKKVSCFGSSKEKAEAHVKALYANTKEKFENEKDHNGFSIRAVALTNQPHLSLKDHPIEIVKVGEEEFMRIPVIPAGNYRHPKGKLSLNTYPITDKRNKLNQIIANHYTAPRDSDVYVRPGHVSGASWGWANWMAIENNIVVAYARPTRPDHLEAIRNGEYRYASADLDTKFRSNKLSAEADLIHWQDVAVLEDNMDFEKLYNETKEQLEARQKEAKESQKEAEEKISRLEARVAEFEEPDDDIPEAVKLQLEKSAKRQRDLEARLEKAERDSVLRELKQALKMAQSPDKDGRILDAYTLEQVKKFATAQEIETGDDEVIKLENSGDPKEIFYTTIRFLSHLVSTMPRTLQGDVRSAGTENSLKFSFDKEELEAFDALADEALGYESGGE